MINWLVDFEFRCLVPVPMEEIITVGIVLFIVTPLSTVFFRCPHWLRVVLRYWTLLTDVVACSVISPVFGAVALALFFVHPLVSYWFTQILLIAASHGCLMTIQAYPKLMYLGGGLPGP
jgi:hypothetical protein